MPGKFFITGMIFCIAMLSVPGSGLTMETERLIIRDITGNISPKSFQKLVSKVDSTLSEILKFWSAKPRIRKFGKIVVEFDRPLPRTASTVFFWRKENGRKVRIVRVFGGNESPHQLAHKLTSALFPNPDKLIRNMMGEASEMRFGNPLSFPMCGYDKDEWLVALLKSGSYIPLAKIGQEHSDWGMEFHRHVPKVKDRAKQHASYIEAGSFGEFLITRYGTKKIKQFNRLSRQKPRPWQEVFGIDLEQLEARWLKAVRQKCREREKQVSALVKFLRKNPKTACFAAQNMRRKATSMK